MLTELKTLELPEMPPSAVNGSRLASTNGCALRLTESVREKSAAEQTQTINESRGSALSVAGFRGERAKTLGRADTTSRGALPQKARDFHARIAAARKLPGNCGRCGKPNTNGHRQCDRCRAYSKKYKLAQSQEPVTVDAGTLRTLTARVASLEMELARMQVDGRAAYKKGYRTGAAHERKRRDAYQPPVISIQELATINHAYGHNAGTDR